MFDYQIYNPQPRGFGWGCRGPPPPPPPPPFAHFSIGLRLENQLINARAHTIFSLSMLSSPSPKRLRGVAAAPVHILPFRQCPSPVRPPFSVFLPPVISPADSAGMQVLAPLHPRDYPISRVARVPVACPCSLQACDVCLPLAVCSRRCIFYIALVPLVACEII
jgi:hypothetical protein